MADERLRSRERAAAHDPAARVALLAERLRAGTLSRDRLELAAYCGDEASRAVLGPGHAFPMFLDSDPERGGRSFKSAEHVDTHPFVGWLRTLARWGGRVEVRAALAACWLAHCDGAGERGPRIDPASANERELLDAVARWLVDPTRENAAACEDWCTEDEITGMQVGRAVGLPGWGFNLAAGVLRVSGVERAVRESHPLSAIPLVVAELAFGGGPGPDPEAGPKAEARVRAAIQRALIEWALGNDPDPCTRVGPPLVTCTVCGRTKAPLGRSAPLEMSTCEPVECPGYLADPRPSQLWPGERCEPPLCQHRGRS